MVDKVLEGAMPADMPVEQPVRFERVVNLRTAKAIRLKIPQSLLLRANRIKAFKPQPGLVMRAVAWAHAQQTRVAPA